MRQGLDKRAPRVAGEIDQSSLLLHMHVTSGSENKCLDYFRQSQGEAEAASFSRLCSPLAGWSCRASCTILAAAVAKNTEESRSPTTVPQQTRNLGIYNCW